jgi:FkbM family methyltransferase
MFFNHEVAGCYAMLIAGYFNEPETHGFMAGLMRSVSFQLTFIDVGANVGEMTTDFAKYSAITRVVGFEPIPACAKACRLSAGLNGYSKVSIVEKALSSEKGWFRFSINATSPGASSLSERSGQHSVLVETSTLDTELTAHRGPAIILVDVEGHEPSVLAGGQRFIADNRPLIIFEYNDLGRSRYALSAVKEVLGSGYDVYRLRADGRLDSDLESTWNCVAVHRGSVFFDLIHSMVVN